MAYHAQGVPAPAPPPAPMVPHTSQAILPAPEVPQVPQVPKAPQGQPSVHLNWSNFKPEFSGNPNKDAEAYLLCTNDLMNAHHFVEGVTVQRICLTLLGEARLWYQSLEAINVDWQGLQNLFK